jgi:ATP-dependent RNA helicase DDX24/MAK5
VYNEAINEQQLLREAAERIPEKEFVEIDGEQVEVINENELRPEDVLTKKEIQNLKKRASLRRTFVVSATLTKVSLTSRMLTNKKFQRQLKEWKKGQKEGAASDQTHPKVLDILSKLQIANTVKIIDLVKDELRFLPSKVTIQKIRSPTEDKMYFLFHLLKREEQGLAIVFVNSINAVRKVKNVLEFLKVECVNLHSKMRQVQRIDRLEKFEGQKRKVLVTTDVGARGLDIKDVSLVIHYHTPRDMDTFVHRSGRTARGNTSGRVVIISDPDDQKRLSKYVHDLPKDCIHPLALSSKEVFADKALVDEALELERTIHSDVKEKKDSSWVKKTADDLGFDPDIEYFTAKGKQRPKPTEDELDQEQRERSILRKQAQFLQKREQFEEMYDRRKNNAYGRHSTFLDPEDIARIAGSLKRVKK